MHSISVGQLRQNPTGALRAVRNGAQYDVTHHGQVIARLVPPDVESVWVSGEPLAAVLRVPDRTGWHAEWSAERDADRLDDLEESG